MAKTPRLSVVGTGIRLGQITIEAIEQIEGADVVLALMSSEAGLAMLRSFNSNVEDLSRFYAEGEDRRNIYSRIVAAVMHELTNGKNVCFVIYGHPLVFVYPSKEAVMQARELGFPAEIFPGISAADVLYAELLLDPAECGCQSYASSDLLRYDIDWNPYANLLLWQPLVTAEPRSMVSGGKNGIPQLQERLYSRYPRDHKAILFEASIHPSFESSILETTLERLDEMQITMATTLVVPALKPRPVITPSND